MSYISVASLPKRWIRLWVLIIWNPNMYHIEYTDDSGVILRATGLSSDQVDVMVVELEANGFTILKIRSE
jgi:hypothetical protein